MQTVADRKIGDHGDGKAVIAARKLAVAALRAVATPADLVAAKDAPPMTRMLLRAVAACNAAATTLFVVARRDRDVDQ